MRRPDLPGALDERALLEAAADRFAAHGEDWPGSARIDYVRFKPGIGCLLGLGHGGSPNDLGYVRLLDEVAAETCYRKYAPRSKDGAWVDRLPGFPAVFFRFPFDRHVVGLGAVVDPGRVKHILHESVPGLGAGEARVRGRRSTCTILRYKPERRAVVRVDAGIRDERTGEKSTRRFAVRAYADDRGAATLTALRRLEAAGVPVPPPLGYHADRRVLVCGWREGICLADLLASGAVEDYFGLLGELLTRVRAVPVDHSAPVRSAMDVVREASIVLGDLLQVGGGAVRERGTQVLALLGDLASRERAPAQPSVLHGDLHHRQVLVGGDADVAIVDWDETAIGDPREDVANLIAHLELLVLEKRLDAGLAERLEARFMDAAGLPEARALVAPQLVKLATVPFRNLGENWRTESLAILERALHRMRRPEPAR